MNKLVYLFELDSVKKYSRENIKSKSKGKKNNGVLATPGVNALFSEIINKGNTVVITMNQLTDSQFIKEMLLDDVAYFSLLELFKLGAIRLSLYDKMCTASQYVQHSLEKCYASENGFIFSNLPIDSSNKELILKVIYALQYSNLSELKELAEDKDCNSADYLMVYRFVKMILQLSVNETSNIKPKQAPKMGFKEFYDKITDILLEYTFKNETINLRIKQALKFLKEKEKIVKVDSFNRSSFYISSPLLEEEIVANEIINLCYNYTVEDSINGVSKHYDNWKDGEFSFKSDLINRIALFFDNRENELPKKTISKKKWEMAIRFAKHKKSLKTKDENLGCLYEKDLRWDKIKWITSVFKKTLKGFVVALGYILVFCLISLGLSFLENKFSFSLSNTLFKNKQYLSWININFILSSIISIVALSFVESFINIFIKKFNKQGLPSILDSLLNIRTDFMDLLFSLGGNNGSYKTTNRIL